MKRLFICLLILFMSSVAFGTVDITEINFRNVNAGNFDQLLRGWFDTLNTDIANAGLFNAGTGKVFYVDSAAGGSATSTGTSPATAWPTLDDAFDSGSDVTADRGDRIYVIQNSDEDIAAAGVTVDIDGVTIIGLGQGKQAPNFDYTAATSTFIVSADDVTLINLRHRASVTAVVSGLVITGENCRIINNDFRDEGDAVGTDEFNTAISVENGAHNAVIEKCTFRAGAAGAVQAIHLTGVSGATIQDNDIIGDCSVGCIVEAITSAAANSDDLIIRRNLLFQGTMGGDGEINNVAVIVCADGTGGYVSNNEIVSDVATALLMRVGDDMVFMNNFVTDTDGDEFSGTREAGLISAAGSVSAHTDG
ncbi:hypothetical protein LCGC14_0704010 [marine sediment metagenome]|uniref:Right handed beta helix domain-containing protein n=1 Tax=marine sediment metagenome TaxID=412755 RepID=A0A0F9QLN6_9ZZZZ